jgi:hypothetical protein
MRAAMSLVLVVVSVIGVSAAPTSGAERATTFSFRAPLVVQRHIEPRGRIAEHHLVHPKLHQPEALALFPFDPWDEGTTTGPLSPAPVAPADLAAPASTPPVQVPVCRETVEGVTIFRGQACRT